MNSNHETKFTLGVQLVSPDTLQEAFEKWFAMLGRPDSEKRSYYMAWQTAYHHGAYYSALLYSAPAPLVMCADCPRKKDTLAALAKARGEKA